MSQAVAGGATEVPVDSWEFFANHCEKDVLEADNSPVDSISLANKTRIRNFILNPSGPDGYVVTEDSFEDDGTETLPFDLYKQMQAGVRSIVVNAPTLRHTQTVSNVYTVKATLTNVGKIISSATLTILEDLPFGVLFNLPTDVSTRYKQHYGWMKVHPTVRCAARFKMQIEQEWQYGLWSELLYNQPL
jgi:hypothetical protein